MYGMQPSSESQGLERTSKIMSIVSGAVGIATNLFGAAAGVFDIIARRAQRRQEALERAHAREGQMLAAMRDSAIHITERVQQKMVAEQFGEALVLIDTAIREWHLPVAETEHRDTNYHKLQLAYNYFLRACILFETGDHRRAENSLTAACEEGVTDVTVVLNLRGFIRAFYLKNRGGAIEDFTAACEAGGGERQHFALFMLAHLQGAPAREIDRLFNQITQEILYCEDMDRRESSNLFKSTLPRMLISVCLIYVAHLIKRGDEASLQLALQQLQTYVAILNSARVPHAFKRAFLPELHALQGKTFQCLGQMLARAAYRPFTEEHNARWLAYLRSQNILLPFGEGEQTLYLSGYPVTDIGEITADVHIQGLIAQLAALDDDRLTAIMQKQSDHGLCVFPASVYADSGGEDNQITDVATAKAYFINHLKEKGWAAWLTVPSDEPGYSLLEHTLPEGVRLVLVKGVMSTRVVNGAIQSALAHTVEVRRQGSSSIFSEQGFQPQSLAVAAWEGKTVYLYHKESMTSLQPLYPIRQTRDLYRYCARLHYLESLKHRGSALCAASLKEAMIPHASLLHAQHVLQGPAELAVKQAASHAIAAGGQLWPHLTLGQQSQAELLSLIAMIAGNLQYATRKITVAELPEAVSVGAVADSWLQQRSMVARVILLARLDQQGHDFADDARVLIRNSMRRLSQALSRLDNSCQALIWLTLAEQAYRKFGRKRGLEYLQKALRSLGFTYQVSSATISSARLVKHWQQFLAYQQTLTHHPEQLAQNYALGWAAFMLARTYHGYEQGLVWARCFGFVGPDIEHQVGLMANIQPWQSDKLNDFIEYFNNEVMGGRGDMSRWTDVHLRTLLIVIKRNQERFPKAPVFGGMETQPRHPQVEMTREEIARCRHLESPFGKLMSRHRYMYGRPGRMLADSGQLCVEREEAALMQRYQQWKLAQEKARMIRDAKRYFPQRFSSALAAIPPRIRQTAGAADMPLVSLAFATLLGDGVDAETLPAAGAGAPTTPVVTVTDLTVT